ncbi:MAG: MFS transporter [Rhodocyclaceae bacterium]|jgi:MFS family permease|nr:MFS transporter [Rhodocyclaceae bacterium]
MGLSPWPLVATLCLITAINTGFTYFGGSIMNSHMAAALDLDRKSLGLAFGAYGLSLGLALPLVGLSVTRWGVRRSLLAGSLLAACGALGMGLWVKDMIGVLIAYGLVLGVGAALGGLLPAETLVAHWFRRRLALAITVMLSGTALGGFIAAPLFEAVIGAFGGNWRAGWLALAVACLLAAALAALFVTDPPADSSPAPDGAPEAPPASQPQREAGERQGIYRTTVDWPVREALGHPCWWLVALATVWALATFGMMAGHGVVHFRDLGHDPGRAALFLAFLPLAGFAGKLVVGTLGDRVEPRFIWGGAMGLMAAGMALAVTATSAPALYGAAFLLGVGDSAAYPCMVTLLVNYFGRAAYASLMGIMLLLGTLAAAIGSLLAGVVFDHFGSYAWAFYPTAALCLLAGLMLPWVGPPRPRSTDLRV